MLFSEQQISFSALVHNEQSSEFYDIFSINCIVGFSLIDVREVRQTRVRNHDKHLVVRSCTTKLDFVRKNRARQKSCATKIVHDVGFDPKKKID